MRMLPQMGGSGLRVEKLNIEYMTYFEDMTDYHRLVDRLYEARVQTEKCESLGTQL